MELRELAELGRPPGRGGRARGRGQAGAARARPARPPGRRSRAARGRPRAREDPDRALVRRGERARLQPRPVHARPAPGRRDRLVDLEPARLRLRVPPRPDLHPPAARGRDQSRSAEDPGRAPRGDAGAAGDDGRCHAAPRTAVPRPRDPEPDRVRGHVPAARGAARPVPAAHRVRLPGRRRRVGDAGPADRAARRRLPARRR